jgi:hypothetical protein
LFGIARQEPIPTIEPRIAVTFQPARPENVSHVLSFRNSGVVAVFQRNLNEGQLGIIAYQNKQAIAHGWMIINRGHERLRANGYFRLQPREALVHFCSVAEKSRGQGVYQALLCELYRQAFATEPVDRIYIDTESDNTPSRKAIGNTAAFLGIRRYVMIRARGFELPGWRMARL